MPTVLFANNAASTLSGLITAADTLLAVQTGDAIKFPSPGAGQWFPITVTDAANNREIMRCTSRTGPALTVVRAQEGTTALSFDANSRVSNQLTAGTLQSLLDGATPAQIRANSVNAPIYSNDFWASTGGEALGDLTGTVLLDFDAFLGSANGVAIGNILLGAPSNAKPGQTVVLDIRQDGTGGRALTYNPAFWVVPDGDLSWSLGANARNILVCSVLYDGKIMVTCPTTRGGLR